MPASAAVLPVPVAVKDNKFNPDALALPLGVAVEWRWADNLENEHNVRQDSSLFNSGTPTDNPSETFQRRPSAGTFHYFCEVHGSKRGGMDGVIRVRPFMTATGGADDEFTVVWVNGTSDTGNQFDVRYRIGKKDELKPWLTDTSLGQAVFGAGDSPVDVKPGKAYYFKARSQSSSNPTRPSGWSPRLKVILQ